MPKNIVFCADGTWNGPGEPDSDDVSAPASNVYKLFLKLEGKDSPETTRLAKEQERSLFAADGRLQQIAKYLHGVGDSGNFIAKLLGGGAGTGLIARIVRGYTFVSRNYLPGDKIYLIGFSRGAYTARALAGLISAKGLLPADLADPANRDAAYRAGSAVWYAWRKAVLTSSLSFRRLEEIIFDLPHFLQYPPDASRMVAAPIEAVTVWDTVGALGIPQFTDHLVAIDAFQFADTALSTNVRHGRHAVSIDEQRSNFTPTLWDADPARIVQVLFPGGHADVGGGYTTSNNESGLSDCALAWVTRELRALGVAIGSPLIAENPNPLGTAHQEWLKLLWAGLPHRPRDIPPAPGLRLSEAVLLRTGGGAVLPNSQLGTALAAYLPANIATYLSGTAAAAVTVVEPL
jgi:type VI secretion system (T6SS) phospholipase Tle1-like effector